MKNLVFIGDFETKGNLLVTDPCYDIGTWCSGKIKVKPGKYKAYIRKYSAENRVSSIHILHEDYSPEKLSFKKVKFEVGVDSGQAGYFKEEIYQKELSSPVPLVGRGEYERNCCGGDYFYDSDYQKYFQQLLDTLGNGTDDWKLLVPKMMEAEEKAKHKVKEDKIRKIDPEKCEKSLDFYDVCCSLTMGDQQAGVHEFGAVASSGFGDGGYNCYVNKGKEVVASYIRFI